MVKSLILPPMLIQKKWKRLRFNVPNSSIVRGDMVKGWKVLLELVNILLLYRVKTDMDHINLSVLIVVIMYPLK